MPQEHIHTNNHEHHHVYSGNINKAFIIGICLNALFVVFEFIAGFYSNSLSLLSDAFHNITDVGALALALFAFKLSFKKSTDKFTYGFKKSTILVPIANATILLIITGAVGYAAVMRFMNPKPVIGQSVILVAFIGIIINSVSAFLFMKDKNKDLNVKAAYLHLASDAIIALGVVVAGIIIYFTHLYWIDSAASIIIILVVIKSSYGVLKDSVRLSLDAVPADISIAEIKNNMLKITGILDIHDLHVWPMSTAETALTVHIVVKSEGNMNDSVVIKSQINNMLKHYNIYHTTVDIEQFGNPCEQIDC